MNANLDQKAQKLLEELKNGTETKRRAAAYRLGKAGNPFAIPGLTEALQDEDAIVRQNAANALREIENLQKNPLVKKRERIVAALLHFLFAFYFAFPLLDYLERDLAEVLAYVICIAPPIFNIVIISALRKRSPFTAAHALQAMVHPIFPILYMGLFYVSDAETNPSTGTLLAMCMLPLYSFWQLFIYLGLIQALLGKEFTYPIIGRWLKEVFQVNPVPDSLS